MSFFGITDLTTFILGTIFIVLLPGPNSLFVLTVAIKRGTKQGFIGACGVFVGDSILMTLTALGAASVLQTHEALFSILRFGGAIYLFWIGIQLILAAIRKWRCKNEQIAKASTANTLEASNTITNAGKQNSEKNLPNSFYRALIISILNPKAIFFFLSFFVQFVDPTYPNAATPFLVQALIVQISSGLYLTALIFFGNHLARTFNTHFKVAAMLNGFVGLMFCGYGGKLSLTSSIS